MRGDRTSSEYIIYSWMRWPAASGGAERALVPLTRAVVAHAFLTPLVVFPRSSQFRYQTMCIAGKKEEAAVPYFREGNGKDTLEQSSPNGDVIDQLNALTKKKSAQADVKPDDPAFGCYELVKKGHTVRTLFKHPITLFLLSSCHPILNQLHTHPPLKLK